MTDFLPCFNAQLLLTECQKTFCQECMFCQDGHFVRMDVLSGWTFCQEETFCKEDLLSGLHFQGKTQTQTPDNHSLLPITTFDRPKPTLATQRPPKKNHNHLKPKKTNDFTPYALIITCHHPKTTISTEYPPIATYNSQNQHI